MNRREDQAAATQDEAGKIGEDEDAVAALGRPTWVLLSSAPDYRWLLEREDSPWYPTVRLFRQDESRDYARLIDRLKRELQLQIAAFRPSNAGM